MADAPHTEPAADAAPPAAQNAPPATKPKRRSPIIALFTVIIGAIGVAGTIIGAPETAKQLCRLGYTAASQPHPALCRTETEDTREAITADVSAAVSAEVAAAVEANVVRAMAEIRAASDIPLDPASEAAIGEAIERVLTSSDARKQQARNRVLAGDTEGAADSLMALAEDQRAAREATTADEVDTLKDAGALYFANNTEAALNAYERAAALAPDDPGIQNQLGHLYQRVGRLDNAIAAYTKVLEAAGAKDKRWETVALGNLGNVAYTRGDLSGAEAYHTRALALHEELGRKQGVASALTNLGVVAKTRGDLSGAEAYHTRVLALYEELGRKEGVAIALANLGLLAVDKRDTALACERWGKSVALYREVGVPHMVEQVSGWMRDAGCPPADAP